MEQARAGHDQPMAARVMSLVGAISRPPRPGRLAVIGILLIGLIAIAAGFAAWDRHEAVYASYRRETTNLSAAFAEQAARSLQAVDLVLRETQREVITAGVKDPAQFKQAMASEQMHWFLSRHSKNLPQTDAIGLVGDDGSLVNGSRFWPTPVLNVSDRDWYQYLRDHDDPGVFVSRPVRGRLLDAWTFFLARRVNGPHGEFVGIVVAGVDADYFENFYQSMSLQQGGSIALFGRNGAMLARYPHVEAMIGQKLPSTSLFYATLAKGGGTYRTQGFVDGISRIVSIHPLRDYPLVVTVTVAESTILAEWRRQALFIAVGALCMAFGFLVLFGALAARSRRLERHNAELADLALALRESQARFRGFALTASDWLWETDEKHRFSYVSEGVRAFGFDDRPGNLLGRTRRDIAIDAGDDPTKWEEHHALLERHEPFRDFVYTWRNAAGEDGIASVSGDPLFDGAGAFLGYRGTGRDITKQILAEDALRRATQAAEAANYAKTRFLANVSHELRTPLNAILGFSEMLELGMVGRLRAKQAEYVHLIRQSGNHLHDVINDILDFAKVDAGKLDLHDDAGVEPQGVIDACFALMKERAKLGGLDLSAVFAEPPPRLVVDEMRLKQILLNLLSNAIKFTAAGGSVVTEVSRAADGGVAFTVRDTGTGMTAAELKIAMEPFGQVDGGLSRHHEGTGLGLPLARRLAELHGGSLTIDSEKGAGTAVTLALPPERVMRDSSPAMTQGEAA